MRKTITSSSSFAKVRYTHTINKMLPILGRVLPDPDCGILETQPSSHAHLDLKTIVYNEIEEFLSLGEWGW